MRVGSSRVISASLFVLAVLIPAKILAQAEAAPASSEATPPAVGGPHDSISDKGTGTVAAGDSSAPVRRVGGGVLAPSVVSTILPAFSDEARRQKKGGIVLVSLIVDTQGLPQNVHVLRGVGLGLDEKAIEAVKQYRFKPAMWGGKPVPVQVNVRVNFQIFANKEEAAQAARSIPNPAGDSQTVDSAVKPAVSGGTGVASPPQASHGKTTPTDAGSAKPVTVRPATPTYADDPKFQKALAMANERRLPADERLARWESANKIAKGQCEECLHQMIVWQMQQSQWKDAINTANQLDALATVPNEKLFAESQRGAALMHGNNDEPKPEQVKQAEASFRSALALAPKNSTVVWSEGRALAMMGQDEEAEQMFQKYLDIVKMSDPYRSRAEHFLENPRLAAMRMAPAFTLTTSEGEQISLDDMGGKVVLLDFWATWCGPCKKTLPEIQKIAKKFADQPLVVVSISSDKDEAAWKSFVARNQMTWTQYRDADGALSRAYGVASIPRFFTIDADGALQSVKVGSGADVEGDVRKLLNKARDAEKKKAKASERQASGE